MDLKDCQEHLASFRTARRLVCQDHPDRLHGLDSQGAWGHLALPARLGHLGRTLDIVHVRNGADLVFLSQCSHQYNNHQCNNYQCNNHQCYHHQCYNHNHQCNNQLPGSHFQVYPRLHRSSSPLLKIHGPNRNSSPLFKTRGLNRSRSPLFKTRGLNRSSSSPLLSIRGQINNHGQINNNNGKVNRNNGQINNNNGKINNSLAMLGKVERLKNRIKIKKRIVLRFFYA